MVLMVIVTQTIGTFLSARGVPTCSWKSETETSRSFIVCQHLFLLSAGKQNNKTPTTIHLSHKKKLCFASLLTWLLQRISKSFQTLQLTGLDVENSNTPAPLCTNCITPPKFNSSPLKNGGWKATFLLGR